LNKFAKIKFLIFWQIAVFGVLYIGCSGEKDGNPVIPVTESGKMLMKFDRSQVPANVAVIAATLTRNGFSAISQALNILTDSTADLQINNVAAGTWHLKIEAKNSSDKIVYMGETDVDIVASNIIQVNLTLQPTNDNVGGIYIMVTWGGMAQEYKWVKQASGTKFNLHSVFFLDQNMGWAVGDSGAVLKTTDSGISWKKQNSSVADNLNSVYFLDINTGWAVGDNGAIIKTTNGGLIWYSFNRVTQNSLYSVKFINTIIGLIVGGNGTVIYALNEYDYLDLKSISTAETLTSAYYIFGKVGWITGSSGSIFRSTDKGQQWNKPDYLPVQGKLNSIMFPDTAFGMAVGTSGAILKTTNGGLTWNTMTQTPYINLASVYFVNSSMGWIAGEQGKIFRTLDQGASWSLENAETINDLEAITFIGLSGWAVGKNGTILKYRP
jgi:photosystem II stability/assembly factor-like uncharacterized protein